MLSVYSTHGSPGASTTALHLAAHWASAGREVLLIEADPAGGSLSHNLGIQFTPGSASFVASSLPVLSNHLIDHAQDVLFENLHVMPAPASPAGARGIFETFAGFSEELRMISENEMAVIVDGGRITADNAASGLTTGAAAVAVVCRNNSQVSSLELLSDVLAASPDEDQPQGFAVTVGSFPIAEEEWRERSGLAFGGTIEFVADMAADLSAFLNRNKRKSKKWRQSLERVGDKLYPYARPPVSDPARRARRGAHTPSPEPEHAGDSDHGAEQAATGSQRFHVQDPADHAQAPTAPLEPVPGLAPPMTPAAGADSGQYPYPNYLPPASEPVPGHSQPHHLPPSAEAESFEPYTAPPYEQPHPTPEPPTPYPPTGYEPPQTGYPPTPYPPTGYEPPQTGYPPTPYPPTGYEPPQTGYPPTPYPPTGYEPPQTGYPPTPYPPTGYEPPQTGYPPTPYPPTGYEPPQTGYPPTPYPPTGYEPPHPTPDPPAPAPEIKPTGSFRDWAVRLHGSKAQDAAAANRGV